MISSMARAFAIFAFACSVAAASISLPSSSKPNNRDGKSTTTMFLPLHFNNHSNGHQLDHHRRYIQSVPNARMPLHDDLLLNGYYSAHIWIGTPPQHFALIVDTGSTVTYVPCATCEQCGKHQDPNFEPEASSTYQLVKCNIDCPCDNDREVCTYERQYAEMSSSSGVLGEDFVSFGNQSGLNPQRATFGCENMETGDLYSQHADGIMGLGRGDLSIVDQLVDKGVINDSFSICYGGMDMGGGAMVLGGISPPADMVFVRSDPLRSSYYNIALKEVHVAGKMVPLNSRAFDGKHGTVLDSGTTYAYFPEAAFTAFKAAIFKELHALKKIPGPDPNYNDICFSGAGSIPSELSSYFPTVEMVFDEGQKILLSPENYLFRHSKVHGAYCLGVFQNGKDPTTLLGGIVVRNTLVTYDREHKRIGFWKTNCSELWERLNPSTAPPPLITETPPLITGSNQTNSTINVVPSPAPSEPPVEDQPDQPDAGEIQIGLVTFYMSSSLKYPELKPHISELSQSIAKELDLNASQVHLMSFTSRANDTLLKWAIYPTGSADYFINTTAKGILSKLSKNSVHLPESFGSYKLFEWKIEAPPERTWWQKHSVVIVVVSVVMLVSVLLVSGAWFVWRRRQSMMSYKPVDSDSTVAEQELTPLQNT